MQNREQREGQGYSSKNVSRFFIYKVKLCQEYQICPWNSLDSSAAHGIAFLQHFAEWRRDKLFMFGHRCKMHICVEHCDVLALPSKHVDALHSRACDSWTMTVDSLAVEIRLSRNKQETNLISEIILTRKLPRPHVVRKPDQLYNDLVRLYITDSWDCVVKLHCIL